MCVSCRVLQSWEILRLSLKRKGFKKKNPEGKTVLKASSSSLWTIGPQKASSREGDMGEPGHWLNMGKIGRQREETCGWPLCSPGHSTVLEKSRKTTSSVQSCPCLPTIHHWAGTHWWVPSPIKECRLLNSFPGQWLDNLVTHLQGSMQAKGTLCSWPGFSCMWVHCSSRTFPPPLRV